jgi:hypothetical protein
LEAALEAVRAGIRDDASELAAATAHSPPSRTP